MGQRELEDGNEERFQQAMADQLGISLEELDEWSILDEREFTDDGYLVGHFVEFAQDTPVELLTRMGLQHGKPLIKNLLPIRLNDSDYVESKP